MTDVAAPDVAGEILGWKALQVHTGFDEIGLALHTLRSPSYTQEWPHNDFAAATCKTSHGGLRLIHEEHAPNEIPGEDCSCGIYAVDSPERCVSYMRGASLIAQVALSGKVIPGENGWRAERARVAAVTTNMHGVSDEDLERIAFRYGVEILTGEKLDWPETTVTFTVKGKDGERKIGERRARIIGGNVQLLEPFDCRLFEVHELIAVGVNLAAGDTVSYTINMPI